MLARYAEAVAAIRKVIAEAGMSNVYDRMANDGFALISAYIKDRSKEENEEKMRELKEMAAGHGFIEGPGVWQGGPPEPTIFIPGITMADAVALGNLFDQKSVIWGNGGYYYFVDCKTGRPDYQGLVADHFKFLGKALEAEPWAGPGKGYTELNKNRFTLVPPRDRPEGEARDMAERERLQRELKQRGAGKRMCLFHMARPIGIWMGQLSGYKIIDEKFPHYVGEYLMYLPVEYPTHMLAQALHDEISRVQPGDRETLQDKWKKRKLP